MKLGIVGLPNVGKSTLFNAITSTKNAEAANYPFCTIDPNTRIAAVPDARLDKLAEIWTLLTQSPENFKGGAIWSVMTNINGGLKAIGYGLLVLFFAAGLVKTCGSFTDMKKPEHVVKAFIRFALAQGAVMSGMELLTAIFSIVQGIVARSKRSGCWNPSLCGS